MSGKKIGQKNLLHAVVKKTAARNQKPRTIGLEELEENARNGAANVLGALETFFAKWDTVKSKPENLKRLVSDLRIFYDELNKWQSESIRTKNQTDEITRIKRLRNFSNIYETHKGVVLHDRQNGQNSQNVKHKGANA